MLSDILRLPNFSGMIGGKPGKALYFVGLQGQDLVYLDPHFVQTSTTRRNLSNQIETYFCKSFRTISYSDIDPSIGIAMYIDGLEELQLFSDRLRVI